MSEIGGNLRIKYCPSSPCHCPSASKPFWFDVGHPQAVSRAALDNPSVKVKTTQPKGETMNTSALASWQLNLEEFKMRDGYIPASIRPLNLELDFCLGHVKYNIEKLPEMLNNEENAGRFEVLDCIGSIITNICRLVDEPARRRKNNDTFCISTCLESCHQEDKEKFENELKSITKSDIYKKLIYARNKTVAHTNISYRGYGDTQKLLLETAEYLIEREDCLKNLVASIESLSHHVQMSIRKKDDKPLNFFTFTLHVSVSGECKITYDN